MVIVKGISYRELKVSRNMNHILFCPFENLIQRVESYHFFDICLMGDYMGISYRELKAKAVELAKREGISFRNLIQRVES